MKRYIALAVLIVCAAHPAAAQPALTICMQQNDPPLSFRDGDKSAGLDPALATLIAQRLDRPLRIQWFVSRDDPDSSLPRETGALLSDGRCDLVAEYPLTAGTLEPPRAPTATLPPFAGARPDDRRRRVPIGPMAATRPYRAEGLTVVLPARDSERTVRSLNDLRGLKIGVQIATLADAVAMSYHDGVLAQTVMHVPDARNLFQRLTSGEIDAAFVDVRVYDAWRLQHGAAGLVPSGYLHSLTFNMGVAALAANKALIDSVDKVLADLSAAQQIARLAAEAGVTFIPPRQPNVSPDVPITALNGD